MNSLSTPVPVNHFAKYLFLVFLTFICFISSVDAQLPCDQRVIQNADFTYTGAGPAPSRWSVNQADTQGVSIDQNAFTYLASGNFSNLNLNPNGGTNNSTRQYAVVSNPNVLSPQYANIPTDGMLVINPLQGQNDQYATYSIAGLVPGNTYTVEIKVWNVIDMAMPGACGQWCNWNDQLEVDWAGNGNNAHDGLGTMTWTGTNGTNQGWNGYGNQINSIMKISSGGAYAVMTAQVTLASATTGFTITFKKGSSSNPIVLGIDYVKVYGCQQETLNISGGSTTVCEASQFTLTAQGIAPIGSTYQWYLNNVLLPGRTSDTLNIISPIGPGTQATYKAVGQWDNVSTTITSRLCCSSVNGTSDEVIRQSFNGLSYTCTGGRSGGYADIPGKNVTNFIDPAYIYSGTACDGLNDGHYAVVQSSFAGDYWRNRPEVKDHTGAAASGALFINAIGGVGQAFYKFNLTGLCNGTTYEFSVWYASLATGGEIKPNIEFDVLNGATKVASTSTGIIAQNEQWYEANVTFTTPTTGTPTYTLQAVNLVTGSSGNDLMLDDIVVKKCTPGINLFENGTSDSVVSVCDNNPVNIKVSTFYDLPLEITGSSGGTVYYQWMSATSPTGPWTLLGTPETTGTYSATATPTTTYYRAKVSADQTRAANGQTPLASDCGNDAMTYSFKLTKGGNFTIPPITGTTAYCVGATMTLTGDPGTGDQWEWRKGTSVATATPIAGYTYSSNVANKVFTKTFAAGDAGTYYFFSKTNAGCESYSTVTVTANTPVTPSFTQVAAICAGATLNALPTTSTNGIPGTWSPAIDNTTTTTYTFTPNAGQCATTTTMTITVNPVVTPTFTAVAGICSGGTLSPLPTTSTNGITGSWSPTLNNTTTTTYTFTPTAGQCATTTTMTIAVNSGNVTPTFTPIPPICKGDPVTLLTTSTNGITGNWSPALNNQTTTTYTFTPNPGQCATTATMTITVNNPTTPTFNAVNPVCSGTTISPLPTTSTNGITGTWSPALNNTATTTYTFTPDAGQCAATATLTITVTSSITPVFTQVAPICAGGTLSPLPTTSNNGLTGSWSPALDNTTTTTYTFTPDPGQCGVTATMTITVNPIVTPTFSQVNPVCVGTSINPLPTTSTNGITGTWSPAINNTATTTYTFTPDAGQCAANATMTITVNAGPIPPAGVNAARCGTGTVTLTASLNGNPSDIISWYSDATLATQVATGTSYTTPSISATTNYYITEVSTGSCPSSPVTVTATVNPVPAAPAGSAGAGICGSGTITLTATLSGPPSDVIAWYSDPGLTTQVSSGTSYTTPTITTTTSYYITETNTANCVSTATTVTAVINQVPSAPSVTDGNRCGPGSVNLSASATASQSDALDWYSDAGLTAHVNTGTGFVTPSLNNTTSYYVTETSAAGCASISSSVVTATINQLPQPPLAKTPVNYCQGATATQLAATGNNLTWYNSAGSIGAVAPIPSTSAGGIFTYYVTQSNGTCESEKVPIIVNIDPISAYAGGPTVYVDEGSTVTLNGTASGTNITILWSPATFLDKTNVINPTVTPTDDQVYTLLVQSTDGCSATDQVSVILLKHLIIPNAFSPNGDGINDRWVIKYLDQYPESDVSVFNRYGQLVFESKGNNNASNGWDGTYNGQPVSVGAYYYVIKLGDGKPPISGSIAVIR